MKFTIRFADQIVGAFIVLAIGIVIFVIFMLGSNQRWFSRDYSFKTYFQSAAGLSPNMPILYKGFTIGRVKLIRLAEDDQVEATFIIFDTYIDRVKTGSLVELRVSPIGALGGNQFLFLPGLGKELLNEGDTIPSVNSAEGKQLMMTGLAIQPEGDDNISNIISSAGEMVTSIKTLIAELQEAFEGSDRTSLGRTMGGVEGTVDELKGMVKTLPADINDAITSVITQLEPILENLNGLTEKAADPDGTIASLLDSDGKVYQDLVKSLDSLSNTLGSLETSAEFIPEQLPQLAKLMKDLTGAIVVAQDVLTSLTNNPLLKRGIPDRKESNIGGAYTRDAEF